MKPGDVVRLSVPAATAFVGVARSLAAGVATRLDFDLDHVEDLRLAVSEACAIVLPAAAPGSDLALDLHIGRDELTLELTSVTTDGEPPGVDSFAWTVLTALADDASADVADGRLNIRLRFVSAAAPLELDDPAAAELS
jgi:serine/threonine-protein kinase RsbW